VHQTPKAAHGGDPRRWRRAVLRYQAGYGYKERKHLANQFGLGEGLVGQCAQEKERILDDNAAKRVEDGRDSAGVTSSADHARPTSSRPG
jgi:hypothetical protein